ncbi:MAG: endonuclease/exonuclease/phosphatase family protein [Schaalia hyovaginalis]|uniref:endonuclease/exonuclease/phosphatase family protein n=1 Tax=Schaalia hyovaginalis TaxID=29316 RepID=UPI002A91C388|nr:endonuclease/exonuclease/phosphatase family protein [Schaalia hyovaginalis]MDY6214574.1 endonuclease/exonuclease/phosphatase family protein [Schaalia hyovaginalis]
MPKPLSIAAAVCLTSVLGLASPSLALAAPTRLDTTDVLTIATFNASLNRDSDGQLLADLAAPNNPQASNAAETIQRIAPDILLINEFDYDADGRAVDLFRKNYLEIAHNGAAPVTYPYAWSGPVNTGVPSGQDLDNDGATDGPGDALGFGKFPGQYGLVVYSKYPIKTDMIRTFQHFLWKDMPGALLPTNPDGTNWYSDEEIAHFPLSSKTHADLPIDVDGTIIHVLAAHPTPPSFDGPEQRNKKRNFDEIRVWADYIANNADYLYDDTGTKGGLPTDANFVILGDYNSDPLDGDSHPGAIDQLLTSSRVVDTLPTSEGGPLEAQLQGGANLIHKTDPKYDTGDFGDEPRPGNLRIDYVLPNAGTQVDEAKVFWPTRDNELFRLTGIHPFPTSDHRMVWTKLRFPKADATAPHDPTQPGPQSGQSGAPSEQPGEYPSQPSQSTDHVISDKDAHRSSNSGSTKPVEKSIVLANTGTSAEFILASSLVLAALGTAYIVRRRP